MSWEIGWWRSERDQRLKLEYLREQRLAKEQADKRRELIMRVSLSVIAAVAAMAVVVLII